MLRARRRDVNLKPNRRLDRKSSRGMLYENEELRLRTININAEVERGQNDIKKLRRENEQLRREIWGLREEYDRLEQLLGSLHPRAEDESEEECEDGENAKNLQRANDGLSVVEEEPLHPQEPTSLTFPVGGNLEQLLREVRGDDQSDTNSHTDCERPEESSPTPLVTTLPAGDSDSDWERKETTDRFRSQISIQLKPPDENPFSGSFQEALDGRSVLFSSSLQDLGPSSNADARHSDRKRWLPPLKMSLSSSSQDPGSPAPDPNPTPTPTPAPAPALPTRMSSAISPESPSNRRVSVNFSKKNSTAARSGSVYSRSFSVDGERLDSVARADGVAAPDRSVPWCACWGNGCI